VTDHPRQPREILDAAMQQLAGDLAEETGQQGAICTGWVVVSEWSTPDGQMWCARYWAEHTPAWRRAGLLHEGLFGTWAEGE
jgi:hypothetical protein